jgi:hypothetical protein
MESTPDALGRGDGQAFPDDCDRLHDPAAAPAGWRRPDAGGGPILGLRAGPDDAVLDHDDTDWGC